jgi:hypothetical protein
MPDTRWFAATALPCDDRFTDHLLKEMNHLATPGQPAQITVDHNPVKTVIHKEQQVAKQPCECLHRSPSRVLVLTTRSSDMEHLSQFVGYGE